MNKFVVIDVETANHDRASICAIGVATFENGKLISEWYSLIDPKDSFYKKNISIHGIDERMVAGYPTYRDVAPIIEQIIGDMVVVAHTPFDRSAMHKAANKWSIQPPLCLWIDSERVARHAWGVGKLAEACKKIGYEFQHHHALEDAKATGRVMLAAMSETRLDFEEMKNRFCLPPYSPSPCLPEKPRVNQKWFKEPIKRDGNTEGPLFGEVVAFTGELTIPRTEAANLAAGMGCNVGANVTQKTTILVVGGADIKHLIDNKKSTKHRRADELIAQGYPLKIFDETEFNELVTPLK